MGSLCDWNLPSCCNGGFQLPSEQLASSGLQSTMDHLALSIGQWHQDQFTTVRTLQMAPRNQGRVDEMKIRFGKDAGKRVAVKIMPQTWMKANHAEFLKSYPGEIEYPWIDVGIVGKLNN